MGFYQLSKEQRREKTAEIESAVSEAIAGGSEAAALDFCGDKDTYIRKAAYKAIGKLYEKHKKGSVEFIEKLYVSQEEKRRQTAVYACGEIACADIADVEFILEAALRDSSASVRNAVTGALKTAAEKNHAVLRFCDQNILSDEAEVRRLVCHGLELRGRKRPQDVLPMLEKLQFEQNRRVRDMLVHVLGQISYKKGCFRLVAKALRDWQNKAIYEDFKREAQVVHARYERFSELTAADVTRYFENE